MELSAASAASGAVRKSLSDWVEVGHFWMEINNDANQTPWLMTSALTRTHPQAGNQRSYCSRTDLPEAVLQEAA